MFKGKYVADKTHKTPYFSFPAKILPFLIYLLSVSGFTANRRQEFTPLHKDKNALFALAAGVADEK